MNKILPLIFLLLSATACVLNPQTVRVDPELKPAQASPGETGTTFQLIVQDLRDSNVLGERATDENETAPIKSEEDLSERIASKLAAAFTEAGFEIDETANKQLVVNIIELAYQGYGETRVSEVEVSSEIHATAVTENGNFSKQYKAKHRKEVLKAPGSATNEELINDVFAAVVQRVLDDTELLTYLKN